MRPTSGFCYRPGFSPAFSRTAPCSEHSSLPLITVVAALLQAGTEQAGTSSIAMS